MEKITITTVDTLASPVYVLVAGGIAIGKTHVVDEFIKTIPIMDIDSVMDELGLKEYNKENFDKAMAIISERFDVMMAKKESLVAMGTAMNLPFSINRLYNAKMMGYTTVLLHVVGSVGQEYDQNEERRKQGQRAVKADELHKIKDSIDGSSATVKVLRKTDLVDYFIGHFNHLP